MSKVIAGSPVIPGEVEMDSGNRCTPMRCKYDSQKTLKKVDGESSSQTRENDGEVYNNSCLGGGWEAKWYYQLVWAARRWRDCHP
jgi:hypothetical protein